MTKAFGRFDFWINKITISRLLNTDKVSKEAIMSVIYHEFLHQEMDDHNADFEKYLKAFPHYRSLERELNHYYKNPEDLASAPKATKDLIDFSQVFFCVVPYKDEEDYLEAFHFYNHYFYVNLGKSRRFAKKHVDIINPHIIWLAKNKTKFHVVGWSIHNQIYAKKQRIRHEKFSGLDLDYQIKTKNDGFYILPAQNCNCTLLKSKLPKDFEMQGICHANDVADATVQKVTDFINQYNCEIYQINFTDDIIDACVPLIEKDTEKIISMSLALKEDTLRSLCLANLAAKQDPCFETVFNKADALRWVRFFDEAAIELEKAHQLNPSDSLTIGLCVQVFMILEEYDKAKEYLYLLSDEHIKELESAALDHCIAFLDKLS